MYKLNDMVVYATHGVCKIEAIEQKEFMGIKKWYYILKPVNNNCSTYFVPADNKAIVNKMRKVLTIEEINRLIDSMPEEKENWITDEIRRKETYKHIISSGKHIELIKLIKALFFEKREREAVGKRLFASDERFLKEAKQILHGEFQFVLNLSEDELITYIFNRIEANRQ